MLKQLTYEICEICFWEDDGQDESSQDECLSGPNKVSLKEVRFNFIVHGAAEKKDLKYSRSARHDDINLRNYRLEYNVVFYWRMLNF